MNRDLTALKAEYAELGTGVGQAILRPMSAEPAFDHPPWSSLMLRGVLKKCGRCGAGRIFDGWFQQKERCPGCGLKFEREPGFFVGAYLINFAIVIIMLFVLCMGFVAMKAIDHNAAVAPIVIAGLVIAVVAPVAFYPFSRTIWSAFDVGMTPLEPHEVTDAADALQAASSLEMAEV